MRDQHCRASSRQKNETEIRHRESARQAVARSGSAASESRIRVAQVMAKWVALCNRELMLEEGRQMADAVAKWDRMARWMSISGYI